MARQRNSELTIRSLLDASQDIIAEEGVSKLTLDAVTKRASLSKGAALYHFHTKDELAQRLLQDAVSKFDAVVEQIRGEDRSAGSFTRAYIRATLLPPQETEAARALQVIGALSGDPAVDVVTTEAVARWCEAIAQDGLDPVDAQIVRLAVDGLWLHETGRNQPMDETTREKVLARLLSLAGQP